MEVYLRDSDTPPSLVEFVSLEARLIFHLLGLAGNELDWLTLPRAFWPSLLGYQKFQKFINNLHVVNDSSGRAVKLIQDNVMAKSKERQQNLLHAQMSWIKPAARRKISYVEAASAPAITPTSFLITSLVGLPVRSDLRMKFFHVKFAANHRITPGT